MGEATGEPGRPSDPDSPEARAEARSRMTAVQAIYALPTEPYLGLTKAEALARAASEGREVEVHSSLSGPYRPVLRYLRLKIAVNDAGIVVAAKAG